VAIQRGNTGTAKHGNAGAKSFPRNDAHLEKWNTCKRRLEAYMKKKEIVFFDELGFGWVVDPYVMKKIHAACVKEEMIVERTLADLLRRNKSL
jgi:hypothetical protein